jgi:peptidoglycan/xylan/chitin deacetylase (PgdA/CDA1 family)
MLTARIIRKIFCSIQQLLGWLCTSKTKKTIYLTFDDGPHPICTEQLLDLLSSYNVKATFFCVGNNIDNNRILMSRIIQNGHVLGNHTQNHKLFTVNDSIELNYEIDTCQNLINKYQENVIRLFRPPGGLMKIKDVVLLFSKKFRIVLWDIDSLDSKESNVDYIISRLKSKVSRNCVILFHDDSMLCVDALKKLLPDWIKAGYSFKSF